MSGEEQFHTIQIPVESITPGSGGEDDVSSVEDNTRHPAITRNRTDTTAESSQHPNSMEDSDDSKSVSTPGWEGWDLGNDGISDPYRNARNLLGGDGEEEFSIASSSDITFANINLASGNRANLPPKRSSMAHGDDKGKNMKNGNTPVITGYDHLQYELGYKQNPQPKSLQALLLRASAFTIAMLLASASLLTASKYVLGTPLPTWQILTADVSSDQLNMVLPKNYDNFAGVDVPASASDIPLVWTAPGDGNVLPHVLSKCVGLVAAGGLPWDPRQTKVDDDVKLQKYSTDNAEYMNVNLDTIKGINQAEQKGLIEDGRAEVLYSHLIYESGTLFTSDKKGRCLVLFPDPVQRIATVYHSRQEFEPEKYQDMSLETFLQSSEGAYHNNWLTKVLAGGVLGQLDEDQFNLARSIMETKCTVKVASDFDEAMPHFIETFGWSDKADTVHYRQCLATVKANRVDRYYPEDSEQHKLIESYNQYDKRLLEVATMLNDSEI